MMPVYSDEDNEPMRDDSIIEYTGIINDNLFRETGECVVIKSRNRRMNNGTDRRSF